MDKLPLIVIGIVAVIVVVLILIGTPYFQRGMKVAGNQQDLFEGKLDIAEKVRCALEGGTWNECGSASGGSSSCSTDIRTGSPICTTDILDVCRPTCVKQGTGGFEQVPRFEPRPEPKICPTVCVPNYYIQDNKCMFQSCGSGCTEIDNINNFNTIESCESYLNHNGISYRECSSRGGYYESIDVMCIMAPCPSFVTCILPNKEKLAIRSCVSNIECPDRYKCIDGRCLGRV